MASVFHLSGAAFLASGLLNLAALAATRFRHGGGETVPGALYPILNLDGWLFSLLCVLSFTILGIIGIAVGQGFLRRSYWARSLGLSFSLMAASAGILLAIYISPVLGTLAALAHIVLLTYLLASSEMAEAFPVVAGRHGRSASQFSMMFLINGTAFGSLVVGPLLPLIRFRHMAGSTIGVPLCSVGSIARSLSGNWADLLLAPVFLVAVLMLVGLTIGRGLCGWACPIGFLQDLGSRAKSALGRGDIEPSRKTHDRLKLLKYAILLFALLLAVDIGVSSIISPGAHDAFVSSMAGFPLYQQGATPCELCPSPIVGSFLPDDLVRNGLAGNFLLTPESGFRIIILVAFVVGAMAMPRFYCRYLCPAGAMAALFNRTSALAIEKDQDRCTGCNYCVSACPMRVQRLRDERVDSRVHDMECTFCLECIDSCPERALSLTFQGRPVYRGGKAWWLRTLQEGEGHGASGKRQDYGRQADNGRIPGRGTGGAGALVILMVLLSAPLLTMLSEPATGETGRFNASSFPPRNADGNYTLCANESWTLDGQNLTIVGNVTLNEDSTLSISGGSRVSIVGNLWVAGRSSLEVSDSWLTMSIPEHPPMRRDRMWYGPNGFVLVDELARVDMSWSMLKVARFDRALNHGEVKPPFANRDENYIYRIEYLDPADRPYSHLELVIDGDVINLTQAEPDDTTYRDGIDFEYTTRLPPGNHTYHFEGMGPDGPLRFPPDGELDGPHVETDEPIILIGSETLANFGSFNASNSTIEVQGSLYTNFNSQLRLYRSSMAGGLTAEINPTCILRESNIPSIVVKGRTGRQTVFLHDCTVDTAVMQSFANVVFEQCIIASLDLQGDSITTVRGCTLAAFNSGGNATGNLYGSTVRSPRTPMRLAGDSCVRVFNGSSIELVRVENTGRFFMQGGRIGGLDVYDDSRACTEGVAIGEFCVFANASVSEMAGVNATLNGRPAQVSFRARTGDGLTDVRGTTGADGTQSFAVAVRTTRANGRRLVAENLTVDASFRALRASRQFAPTDNLSVLEIALEDRASPSISDVRFDYYFRPEGEALVSAVVGDGGGAGVCAVRMRYSVEGGRWMEGQMFRVGPDRYEGTLAGLESASRLELLVTASDWMNNTASSAVRSETLGVPPQAVAAGVALSSVAVVAAAASLLYIRRDRIRRYLDGEQRSNEK